MHGTADSSQKGKGIQIGENAEKSEQLGGGRREMEGGKGPREVDLEGSLLAARESPGGAANEGKVGVGGQQVGGRGKFPKKKGLFESIGATESHQGVVSA